MEGPGPRATARNWPRRPRPATIRPMRRLLASLLFVSALGTSALARSEKTLGSTREAGWPTAVRFLVVDEHVKITDKDPDTGYVLFELRDEGKTFRGSLEVVTVVR